MPLKLSLIAPKPPPNHKSVTIGFDLVFEPWFASAEGCRQLLPDDGHDDVIDGEGGGIG
jgi:hypothetical protein